jgi:glucose-1-phosphate thymidylyltransferase
MQVIIPLAGKGTRLKPHTHTKAKPLIHVAGKPVLAHILDELVKIKVEEVIFVVGHLKEQIIDFVKENYKFRAHFVEQKELLGQAHAVWLTEKFITEDVLIWFVDTLTDADLNELKSERSDGVVYVKEDPDPVRFGQVIVGKDGIIKEIVEKADPPKSNLVNIGLYWVKDHKLLFECIADLMARKLETKGEYYLVDAFQLMFKRGAKFAAKEVKVWEDCGKLSTLLKTNRYFLDHGCSKVVKTKNSVIIPPVYIEESAEIVESVIGPYVSVAKGTKVIRSIIKDSILSENALVENAKLSQSLVGDGAIVKGMTRRMNVGDSSEIIY